ncbi:MAG: hypothetical protein H7330_12170 [Hymenobacteraceae bacterium]|nr:hypothetical protein [Hymenobacteraceae bacterium]
MKRPPTPAPPAADEDDLPAFLRDRPRRTALSVPPTDYFDALPARVLTRIRTEAPRATPAFFPVIDLSSLRWPRLRLAFASAALSAAFVGAFWLGQVQPRPGTADQALASVDAHELVEYLADPTTVRLSSGDLSTLSTADVAIDTDLLTVPRADLDAALDELPLDETYL